MCRSRRILFWTEPFCQARWSLLWRPWLLALNWQPIRLPSRWQCRQKQRSRICPCQVSWDRHLRWTFRTASLSCLGTGIQVLESDIVSEAAYEAESQTVQSGNETLLREESVCNHTLGYWNKFIFERIDGPEILSHKRVWIVHMLQIFGYAPTPLFVECLFRNHVCAAGGIGVDKSKPHQLQAPLHWRSAAWPEVAQTGSLLSGLAYVTRINGDGSSFRIPFGNERFIETDPVTTLLPEIHAEALFRRMSEPLHLEKVDAIRYGKKKFHGFLEERLKRFA